MSARGSEVEGAAEVELRRTRGRSARGGEERAKREEVWMERVEEGVVAVVVRAGVLEGRVCAPNVGEGGEEMEARRPELTTFDGGPKSISSASNSISLTS